MNNEAFEKWGHGNDFIIHEQTCRLIFYDGFKASQSASAARIAELEAQLLAICKAGYTDESCRNFCTELTDRDTRIAELESDCLAMAEIVLNRHQDTCIDCTIVGCKKGLTLGRSFIRDCCNCPICLIAAKYREG